MVRNLHSNLDLTCGARCPTIHGGVKSVPCLNCDSAVVPLPTAAMVVLLAILRVNSFKINLESHKFKHYHHKNLKFNQSNDGPTISNKTIASPLALNCKKHERQSQQK